jgi:hypothetical protein
MLHCHKVSYILLLHCQVMLNGSGYTRQLNSLFKKEKPNGIQQNRFRKII